ncbi:MAG: hypothetical protein P8163_11825 [Candidatus Thiodiazotropha sp.]
MIIYFPGPKNQQPNFMTKRIGSAGKMDYSQDKEGEETIAAKSFYNDWLSILILKSQLDRVKWAFVVVQGKASQHIDN